MHNTKSQEFTTLESCHNGPNSPIISFSVDGDELPVVKEVFRCFINIKVQCRNSLLSTELHLNTNNSVRINVARGGGLHVIDSVECKLPTSL